MSVRVAKVSDLENFGIIVFLVDRSCLRTCGEGGFSVAD